MYIIYSLGQWLDFKLLGITCLVGKRNSLNFYLSQGPGSICWVSIKSWCWWWLLLGGSCWSVEIWKKQLHLFLVTYCWWTKSCTAWYVWNLVNNGINYLSTGAGFLPSTVCGVCVCVCVFVFLFGVHLCVRFVWGKSQDVYVDVVLNYSVMGFITI